MIVKFITARPGWALLVTRINSIQEFGLAVAAAVWLVFVFSFLFLPALMVFMPLAVFPPTRQVKRGRVIKLLDGIVQLNRDYHRVIHRQRMNRNHVYFVGEFAANVLKGIPP
ncbi:MMPL family transporter [bacterium]|nr:MMPL family transporter [bacterium]